MSQIYSIVVEGLEQLAAEFQRAPEEVQLAAQKAINKTVVWARTRASERMRQQINFSARYLVGADGKLQIPVYATAGSLEAKITGRARATSLALFATNTSVKQSRKNKGVSLAVKAGAATFMRGAFLVRLKRGQQLTETQYNLGLAIRLKPGETIRNKKKAGMLTRGVYLLYGPSVDQVFNTVAEDLQPEIGLYLENEFNRLLRL